MPQITRFVPRLPVLVCRCLRPLPGSLPSLHRTGSPRTELLQTAGLAELGILDATVLTTAFNRTPRTTPAAAFAAPPARHRRSIR